MSTKLVTTYYRKITTRRGIAQSGDYSQKKQKYFHEVSTYEILHIRHTYILHITCILDIHIRIIEYKSNTISRFFF